MKYTTLIRKGDAIAQRFLEKRAIWNRFKHSDAADDIRLLSAMVDHLREYERRKLILSAEGAKEFAASRQN